MKPNIPLYLIPLFPLLGFLINGLLLATGRRLSRVAVGAIACLMPLLSFAVSLSLVWQLHLAKQAKAGTFFHEAVYTWIASGDVQVRVAFFLDSLSAIMVLVVTGVGSLIHIYSNGYMEHDEDYARYFAYLNLFMFAMLLLVLGDNLLVLFVGWEGVGLASYLLIGFWFTETDKAIAGMKAFLVNRIGDLGFLVGIFLVFVAFSTFDFAGLQASFRDAGLIEQLKRPVLWKLSYLEWAGVCFFIGAMGKSAQIPLYVWLPDAMAGPTPVSALIHAATMVTAGVYMVARLNFLYLQAPTAMAIIAWVGALTAFFAATMGLFQNDIKKVLAYSTVSQLGFMFIGVGVGAFSAGVFHLMTHAFFKALLFLGAGAVIYGMHHEQDIRKMGGLLKRMPITGATFLIGTLAIIGFPGLAGFFSKDEILWMALATKHPGVWVFGTVAAVLTAFYMMRLTFLTFFGNLRLSEDELHHMPHGGPKDPPFVMTVPLMVLALLSVVGGWIGIPHVLGGHNHLHHWLEPVFHDAWAVSSYAPVFLNPKYHPHTLLGHGVSAEWAGMGVALGGMLLGVIVAFVFYNSKRAEDTIAQEDEAQIEATGGAMASLYRLLYNKYYVDELYQALIVRPLVNLSRSGLWPFDQLVIDGFVRFFGASARFVAQVLSWLQSGNVKVYMYSMAVGLVALLLWLRLSGLSF
ncbi:MAG: NADH-quinone oxidoreductase subunit L [Myxococcales bacterium]|nr:NADH-quinone oxidoreductase subunit L [Myxococcales bacterium]